MNSRWRTRVGRGSMMPIWLPNSLSTILVTMILLSCFDQSAVPAGFFPGNIFELRPPRVQAADPHGPANTLENRQYFAFEEQPPRSTPQEDIYLTDSDLLFAVFPVSNGSFSSGESAYVFAGLTIVDFNITLDYYRFPTLFSGDALVAPWEQSVFIGTLPVGEYTFNLRRWFLKYEDRSGFDKSQVERQSVNHVADGIGIIALDPPNERYFTEDRFTFFVKTTAIPEPASFTIAVVIVTSLFIHRKRFRL